MEWTFPQFEVSNKEKGDFHLFQKNVREDKTVKECILSAWNNANVKLKSRIVDTSVYNFSEPFNFHVLTKLNGVACAKTYYFIIDLEKTIRENLKGKEVIEFPTFIVVQKDKLQNYEIATDQIVKDLNELTQNHLKRLLEDDSGDENKGKKRKVVDAEEVILEPPTAQNLPGENNKVASYDIWQI